MRFCDCFNIPIITFEDVPGFLPGDAACMYMYTIIIVLVFYIYFHFKFFYFQYKFFYFHRALIQEPMRSTTVSLGMELSYYLRMLRLLSPRSP